MHHQMWNLTHQKWLLEKSLKSPFILHKVYKGFIKATDMTAVMDYRLHAADGFIMDAGKNFDITQQHCCNLL